ncbi:unnamed protein product [Cuscuta epithymum]|uniref:Pentatricopeptide repeat-containing protein n=1 Tax=Cuscuta epithymum TaxID=186058 RepID=A0AAV0GDJ4_9ASTE|nr:unnamed protein product [Cuscuta epithymum]CAH9146045.1 unnamed protein product [Cuscuta epithymum]
MASSKLSFFNNHVRTLTKRHFRHQAPSPSFRCIRFFSFATPEEAAAERRKRKRRLRIEPPISALRQQQQQQPRPMSPQNSNPNAPKIPETVAVLTGNRLNLHNRILKLIRENDLEEAALLTRHSIYSNCRPTIFTCNSVMAAQLRQSRYADLLSLHRFITQAGVAANIVTHNLLLSTYMDCRKTDMALEHYKQLINDAPFNPSPTTYRILIKGLVDNSKLEKAIELKEEMLSKGFKADPIVYNYLMSALAKNSDSDGIFQLYEELKEKSGGSVSDGVVYGSLMKGYFLKGMEDEAMKCYAEAVGENSTIKMNAVAFNHILDALSKNGKFEEALSLFDRMMTEHDPPKTLTVNLGSFNVIVDGYCAERKFSDAINVFKSMGTKRVNPDTLSYNNLIEHLCNNDFLAEAEELYKDMEDKKVKPDEVTFVLLMDTCFKENRHDDGAEYFKTMVESKLRPNMGVYNRLVEGLVNVEKIDKAKSFFDMMMGKLRMRDDEYKFIMNALFDVGKHEEVLAIVDRILREDPTDLTDELKEFIGEGLKKEGREEELTKLIEDIEREKAEAAAKIVEEAERAKASTREAVNALLNTPRLFGKKEPEDDQKSTENAADASEENITSTIREAEVVEEETDEAVSKANG